MREYLAVVALGATFYILHKMIVIHGKRIAYIFWGLSQLVILALFFKSIATDIAYIPSIFIIQTVFVIFVKQNIQKKDRNDIYDIMTA